ncbi:hypothetical protein C8R43DRAFT_942533 [Mycena crocata]|nr:hypothetical protein C8R43DRAFT_942533 [Mycena crocata]
MPCGIYLCELDGRNDGSSLRVDSYDCFDTQLNGTAFVPLRLFFGIARTIICRRSCSDDQRRKTHPTATSLNDPSCLVLPTFLFTSRLVPKHLTSSLASLLYPSSGSVRKSVKPGGKTPNLGRQENISGACSAPHTIAVERPKRMEGKVSGAVLEVLVVTVAMTVLGFPPSLSMLLTGTLEGVISGVDTVGDCGTGDCGGGAATETVTLAVGRRVSAGIDGVGTTAMVGATC